jgi:hypothetical protein
MSVKLELLLHPMANPSEIAWNEETYDLGLANDLAAADRSTYVAMLIASALKGDTRAILTLAHLRATEALPMIRAAAHGHAPWAQTARRALVIFGNGAEVVDAIANDAVHGPAKMGRVAAVLDLPKVGGEVAITALEQALADEEDAVRLLAWEGLVDVFALRHLMVNPQGKRDMSTDVEIAHALLGSDLPALVKLGVADMRAFTRQLRAGATPESLGISWSPNPATELFTKLRFALFDDGATFPIEEISTLTDVFRRLAEMMIVMRLENQDPRVPEALVRLGATWTVPALEEVARMPTTPPELAMKLAESARTLRALQS